MLKKTHGQLMQQALVQLTAQINVEIRNRILQHTEEKIKNNSKRINKTFIHSLSQESNLSLDNWQILEQKVNIPKCSLQVTIGLERQLAEQRMRLEFAESAYRQSKDKVKPIKERLIAVRNALYLLQQVDFSALSERYAKSQPTYRNRYQQQLTQLQQQQRRQRQLIVLQMPENDLFGDKHRRYLINLIQQQNWGDYHYLPRSNCQVLADCLSGAKVEGGENILVVKYFQRVQPASYGSINGYVTVWLIHQQGKQKQIKQAPTVRTLAWNKNQLD